MVEFNHLKDVRRTRREKIQETFREKQDLIVSLVKYKSEDELCQIACDLNSFKWDDEKLGECLGEEVAVTLLFYIKERVVGEYKLLKYWNLTYYKNFKNEEDFNAWVLEQVFNNSQDKILRFI